jgi:DNA replication protein DnaC
MNIFSTPSGVKKAPVQTEQYTSKEDRLQQTALTTARSQAKKLTDLYRREPFEWEFLQRELNLATIPSIKLDYATLLGFLQGWVNQAPLRQQREAIRLAEEAALREKRTYSTIDIKLPGGLDFKPQQKKAIAALLDVLYKDNLNGALVPLGTGKGKSWIAAGLALWLQKHEIGRAHV